VDPNARAAWPDAMRASADVRRLTAERWQRNLELEQEVAALTEIRDRLRHDERSLFNELERVRDETQRLRAQLLADKRRAREVAEERAELERRASTASYEVAASGRRLRSVTQELERLEFEAEGSLHETNDAQVNFEMALGALQRLRHRVHHEGNLDVDSPDEPEDREKVAP
jgi:chromosome segregation ATPase